MATNKPRFLVTVDEELFRKIDDFRFEHRYPSRSAAAAYLIQEGLKAAQKNQQQGKSTAL